MSYMKSVIEFTELLIVYTSYLVLEVWQAETKI